MRMFILYLAITSSNLSAQTIDTALSQTHSSQSLDTTSSSAIVCFLPDKDPVVVFKPEIQYPKSALSYGKSAKVLVKALVDTLGNVVSVEIMKSPSKLFNNEALRLAKLYRFNPVTFDAKKLKVYLSWSIVFMK